MPNKFKKGKVMAKNKFRNVKKVNETDNVKATASSPQQLSAEGSVPLHIKKDKRLSSSRTNTRKNRELHKRPVLQGTAGMKIIREDEFQTADSQQPAKPLRDGVSTRSRFRKENPIPRIDLKAAECVLHGPNNPSFLKTLNLDQLQQAFEEEEEPSRFIEQDPEIKRIMKIFNIRINWDPSWLFKKCKPNEQQKNFLANLSQAIMAVFEFEQVQTQEYLEGIFHGRIPSFRHKIFMETPIMLQHDYMTESGAGPFTLDEAEQLRKKNGSCVA